MVSHASTPRGSQHSSFWGFLSIYVYTLCHRTTKFVVVTHVVERLVSWSQPCLPSQESRVSGRPNFGGSPVFMQGYWRQWADERFGDTPPRWIQEPSVVRVRDGRPQEDPLAVHCFCVCSGSVLLGDLLGVSRSRECDLLSVLSIYPRIPLCIFIVYGRVVRILCIYLFIYLFIVKNCTQSTDKNKNKRKKY